MTEAAALNANEIVAKVIVEAANQSVKGVSKPVLDKARRALHLITDAYGPFLESTFQRVKNVKTFLKPNEPVDLLSIYEPAYLSDGNTLFGADLVVKQANSGGRLIISGLAGRGKSVLMRFTAISMYQSPQGKIPLFLELRSINQISSKDLLQFIHAQYKGRGSVIFEDFEIALARGYFCLILDGFDEVEPSARQAIEEQILSISRDYPLTSLIISSRPDSRFQGWQDFRELQVCPMSLDQAKRLIKKANYDDDVTKTFLKRLTKDFYEKHESFLSTPLLIIMMMLTFEDYAEIPTSLHAFYKNAFDTLIRRHDATKPKFVRKTHSNCTAEQFQLLFSSFCILTYSKSKFEFNRDDVLKFISSSLKQQQIDADAECVLGDLIESICLLQQEGFEISFVHRSFQEYFCALFLARSASGLVKSFLETGKFRIWDDMLPMLFGMTRERVEKEWAFEVVSTILSEYIDADPVKYVMDRFILFRFHVPRTVSSHVSVGESTLSRRVNILERFYGDEFSQARATRVLPNHNQKRWASEIRKILITAELKGDDRLVGFSSYEDDTFEFPIRIGDDAIISALGLGDYCAYEMKALNLIKVGQEKRQREDDLFLNSVFEGAPH